MAGEKQEDSAESAIAFTLKDHGDEPKPNVNGRIEHNDIGIEIHVDGYGSAAMPPGQGAVVFLEFYNGELVVRTWADINQEDCTSRISLEDAQESGRK